MKKINIVLLIYIVILLTSCVNVKNEEEQTSDSQEESENEINEIKEVKPTFGETLKIASRNPETLNPLLNKDRSIDQVLKLVFEPLFSFDKNFKPIPVLVDNYDFSEGNSYVTINLKNGIYFHDGEQLTSEDVQYSINVLQNAEESVIYKSCVDNIQRTSIIDDLTIRLYFKQPYIFAEYDLAFPIIPKHYYSTDNNIEFTPIGSGPYKFVDFTSMKNILLTAYTDYRENVYVKDIECTITRDFDAEKTAFEQNLIDLISPNKFDWLNYAEDDTKKITEYTTNYYEFIGFNFENDLLQDSSIRKAIAYGINRNNIAKNQFLNHVVVTEYPIHPESWLGSNELIFEYDINKSKTLLENAGYLDNNSNGYYEEKDKDNIDISFKLLVNSENNLRMETAELIKEDIEKIGLKVIIDRVDSDTFKKRLFSGDYDLVLTGWKLSNKPDFTPLFHSEQINEGSNFIHYNNPAMDLVLKDIYVSLDENELEKNINEFKKIYTNDLPYFSLYFMNSAVITNKFVYGEFEPTTHYNYNGIENIYISR